MLDVDPAGTTVAERIRARGGAARFVRADVSAETDVADAIANGPIWLGILQCERRQR